MFVALFLNYSKKIEDETLPNSFYGASITLIPKPDKDTTIKKTIGTHRPSPMTSHNAYMHTVYCTPSPFCRRLEFALQEGLEKSSTFLSASDTFLREPITKLAFPPGVLLAGLTQ